MIWHLVQDSYSALSILTEQKQQDTPAHQFPHPGSCPARWPSPPLSHSCTSGSGGQNMS